MVARLAASIVPRFDSVELDLRALSQRLDLRAGLDRHRAVDRELRRVAAADLDHPEIVESVGDEEEAAAINVENNPAADHQVVGGLRVGDGHCERLAGDPLIYLDVVDLSWNVAAVPVAAGVPWTGVTGRPDDRARRRRQRVRLRLIGGRQ